MAEATGPGAVPASRPRSVRWGARVVGLLAVWLVWVVVSAAVLVLTGTAGRDGGWAWAVLALAPLVLVTWLILRPTKRPVAVVVTAVVAIVLLGAGVYAVAPASLERVDRISRDLPVPADAVELTVVAIPSDWCLQGCSRVERVYAVPDAAEALVALETALQEHGWVQVSHRWCRGTSFSVQATRVSPDDPVFAARPGPRAGEQAISVTATAGC